MTTLNHQLSTLRSWLNLTKIEVANHANIMLFDVCQLERGSIDTLQNCDTGALAKAYGLSVSAFEYLLDAEYERRVSGIGNWTLTEQAHELFEQAAMGNVHFVVLDTETTGADKNTAEIVQIAIIDHTGNALLNSLIKPTLLIPAGASAIHGIRDKDVVDAPTFATVWPLIKEAIAGKVVIVYNAAYDMTILQIQASMIHEAFPECDPWCLMLEYCEHLRVTQKLSRRPKWQKLGDACTQQGVKLQDAHSALGDTLATYELLRALANK